MKKNKPAIIICFATVLFVILPYLLLQKNVYMIIHDNLDSEFLFFHILKITGNLFGLSGTPFVQNIMNGIPRHCFHSEYNVIRVLFYIFPSFWAYVINTFFVRLIAFIGMYLFAKDYLLKDINYKISIILAAMFTFIPLYTLYGLTVAGQPLLFWAFLNLQKSPKRLLNWLIICGFPLYSHFALIAPFILTVLIIFGIYKLFIRDSLGSRYYFIAVGLMLCLYLVANISNIKSMFFPGDYISHRNDWVAESISIKETIKIFIQMLFSGYYHATTFLPIPIYLLSIVAIVSVKNNKKDLVVLCLPLLSLGVVAFFEAAYPTLRYLLRNHLHILISFQFDRFTFLIPVLWFIILATGIRFSLGRVNPVIIYTLIIIQACLMIYKNDELIINYRRVIIPNKGNSFKTSFKTFYAQDLFDEIAHYINKPKNEYRVASVGLFPAVLQYNGFFTLDSYQNNYPLKYKKEFGVIIKDELKKDPDLSKYFYDWGSRCYIFSSELFKSCNSCCTKLCGDKIKHLDINIDAFNKLGGEYILSSVPINNSEEIPIHFLKKFSHESAMWDIYLYSTRSDSSLTKINSL